LFTLTVIALSTPFNELILFTCPHVPEGVRDDPGGCEDIHPVDSRGLRFSHVQDDEHQENHVGEGRVDAAVQRNSPLLHKPRNTVRASSTTTRRLKRIRRRVQLVIGATMKKVLCDKMTTNCLKCVYISRELLGSDMFGDTFYKLLIPTWANLAGVCLKTEPSCKFIS
jgi:hypothetical protein